MLSDKYPQHMFSWRNKKNIYKESPSMQEHDSNYPAYLDKYYPKI